MIRQLYDEMKQVEIIEVEACPDHIHMLERVPPNISVWWMWLVGGLLVGFGIGWAISQLQNQKNAAGVLREDRSDPTEAPYLFLELEPDGMTKIHKSKTVVFKVDLNGYLPRN